MYLDSKSASRPTSCHAREACRPMRRKAPCRRLPERTSHSRRTTWSCTNGAFRKPFPGRDYIKNGERPENGRSRPSVSRTAVQSGHRPFNPRMDSIPSASELSPSVQPPRKRNWDSYSRPERPHGRLGKESSFQVRL